jgi:ferredoxin-NADP reductase
VPSFTTTLRRAEAIAEGTMAFHLAKPDSFHFRAGQAVDLTLLDPPEVDPSGTTRAFSIVSNPSNGELIVATRMRQGSAFKRSLAALQSGTKMQIEGPSGSFTLHKNHAKPAVFLAGGIGITPFLSMIQDASAQGLPHNIFLFYSNHRPEDAAFLPTLEELQRKNPHFKAIPTMTRMDRSRLPWSGETGYITARMIESRVGTLQGPIYYIAGPPAMVAAMREMLVNDGVDEDDIRTEEFSGY